MLLFHRMGWKGRGAELGSLLHPCAGPARESRSLIKAVQKEISAREEGDAWGQVRGWPGGMNPDGHDIFVSYLFQCWAW